MDINKEMELMFGDEFDKPEVPKKKTSKNKKKL